MCVHIDAFLLADVFQNCRNICLKIYELNPAKFLAGPGLALQRALKTIIVKLDLLTDTDMLLMLEKRIRGEKCHSIYLYAKSDNKYLKDYDKNKELSVVYNRVFWRTLGRAQNNNYKNQIKK